MVDSLPENDDACAEILELLVDHLPKRYPTLFESLSPNGIWNKVTNEKIPDITGKSGVDALLIVSRLVQDDFLMGREGPDGHIYFSGGLVAFPGMRSDHFNNSVNNSLKILSQDSIFSPTTSVNRSRWSVCP